MEFKLKNFRNSPKTIIFYYCYSGTLRGVRAHTPKNHEKKTLKIELFASFCMEFKRKYYEKSSKTIKFTTNFLRQHDSYPLKTQEKITEFQLNKTEKLTKIANNDLKLIKKYWDTTNSYFFVLH